MKKKKLRGRGTSAKWRYKRHKIVFWNRSYKTHPLFCSLPFPDSLMGQRSYLSIDSGTRWGENRVWKVCFSLEILSWRTFFYRSGTFKWHSSTADIHEAVITVNPHLWKKNSIIIGPSIITKTFKFGFLLYISGQVSLKQRPLQNDSNRTTSHSVTHDRPITCVPSACWVFLVITSNKKWKRRRHTYR